MVLHSKMACLLSRIVSEGKTMFGHGVFGRKRDGATVSRITGGYRASQIPKPVQDTATLQLDDLSLEAELDPPEPEEIALPEISPSEQSIQSPADPCMSDPDFQMKMVELLDQFEQLLDGQYADLGGKRLDAHLNAAGALAGFGCQVGVRKALIEDCGLSESSLLTRVDAIDGRHFYTGDMLDEQLFSTNPNVITLWKLAEVGMEKHGEAKLPDFVELAEHVNRTIGTEEFGIPRIPDIHRAHHLPYEVLFVFWEQAQNLMKENEVPPRYYGWLFGLMAQKLMEEIENRISPLLAAKIFLEAAVPMSRVDPKLIPGY